MANKQKSAGQRYADAIRARKVKKITPAEQNRIDREALIEQYVKMQNGNPTKSDTTDYNMLAMRANKPFLTPKKKSTKKDNKGNPQSPEDVVLNDIVLARIEKAKQNIILNEATPSDSLTMYNAGIMDKDLSDKEQEKYKPEYLKKAEMKAENSKELKKYKEQVQPVSMKMVDVVDSEGDEKKIAKYYLEKDGKKTEITKSVYDAINAINRKKLKKYVDPSVNIMEDPDDPLGIG